MITHLTNEEQDAGEQLIPQVAEHFLSSSWYCDIIYVLENLQVPQGMERTKAHFLKQKAMEFYVLNGNLY